ncbi:MAG: hypothetical protein QNJ55_15535 [Xenococcus sp. MO_188.B8]|nr:hypothetical protein [Xenococcus sp. MO_188.B8]
MKNLSLIVTLGLITLVGAFAPVNAQTPEGDSLETSEQNYIIDPTTGEKIDPATGAVIEEAEEVVGEGDTEVMEEGAVIVEPDAESASETVEEVPAQ